MSLATRPQPLPKRILHTVLSSASSFNFQYPVVLIRPLCSCLRLLPRLPATSNPSLYLSVNNVLQKAVPTQYVTNPFDLPSFQCIWDKHFLIDIVKHFIFLTRSVRMIFSILLQHHISNPPGTSDLLERGWVRQKTTVLYLVIIMMTTTCFDHCGPSSVHKMYKGGELHSVHSLAGVHILNFQRDLVVWFISILT